MEPIRPPNKLRQTATLVSGSFFFTVGILGYLLYQSVNAQLEKVSVEAALGNPLVIPFAVVSVVVAIASFLVPKLFLRGTELHPDQKKNQKRFNAFIISMALSETPGVFGYVFGMSTKSLEIALPFFALSFVVMAIHWKKIQDIQ